MTQGFRDLLMGKPVIVLRGDATAVEAAREMQELGESMVAVVDEAGTITGVVTPRDLVFRVMSEGRDPERTELADIQTEEPVCADLGGEIFRASSRIIKQGYSQVPLVMDGFPCGRLEAQELRSLQDRAIEFLSSSDEGDRLDAMHFLASTGGPTAVFAFTQALRDQSAAVREMAVEGLRNDGSTEAAVAVLPFLRDENTVVRNCAIEILSEIGDKALCQLCALAEDPDHDVQIFIMNILGNMGNAGGLPTVLKAMGDAEVRVRQAAVVAAGQIGGTETISSLRKALEDEDEWVRMSAVEALGGIGGQQATMCLRQSLDTGDESLFLAIVEALGSMGDKDAVETIIKRSAMLSPGAAMVVVTSLAERWGVKVIEQVPIGFRRRALEGLVESALQSTLSDLGHDELQLTLALEDEKVVEHLLAEPLGQSSDDPQVQILVEGLARPGYLPLLRRLVQEDNLNQEVLILSLLRLRHRDADTILVENLDRFPGFLRVEVFDQVDPDTGGLVERAIAAVEAGQEDKVAAAEMLSRNLGPQAVDFLAGLLDEADPDPELLGLATQAVCERAMAGGKAMEMIDLARDQRSVVRTMALSVLGPSLPLEMVQDAMAAEDPEVVSAAVQVLAARDATMALQALRQMVEAGDPATLPTLFDILAGMGMDEAGTILGDYIDRGRDDWCRFQAVQAWAQFSGEVGLLRLEQWLDSGDAILETAAANALANLGLPGAVELLARQIEHSNEEVRLFATQAAGGVE